MARSRSNPLALAVLSCLFERPMHPYQVSTTLKQRRKDDSIRLNYGSLYSVVSGLRGQGLIAEHGTSKEGNRPERTVYAITPDGEAELFDWLRELLRVPVNDYPALEAGLALMPVLAPDVVADVLRERLDTLDALIEEEAGMLAHVGKLGLPQLLSIESEYGLAVMRAEREFVAHLIGSIDDKKLGGYRFWARMHELRAQGVTVADMTENPGKYFDESEVPWITAPEAFDDVPGVRRRKATDV